MGLKNPWGEEPRLPGMVRGRLVWLPLLGDGLWVELIAVGASLLHFPEDVGLPLDAGKQRAVECLDDKSLRSLHKEPGSQAVGILETGLVVRIVVLDAVARIDDTLGYHRQDCIDVLLWRRLEEGAALQVLLILEGELCIEPRKVAPQKGIRILHGGNPMTGKLNRQSALEGAVEPFDP